MHDNASLNSYSQFEIISSFEAVVNGTRIRRIGQIKSVFLFRVCFLTRFSPVRYWFDFGAYTRQEKNLTGVEVIFVY